MKPIKSNSYASNVIANLLGIIGLTAIVFLSTPILIEKMGDIEFGLYRISIISIVSFAFLLDLGISSATKRSIGNAIYSGDTQGAHQALALSVVSYGIIALASSLAIFSSREWLPSLIKTPDQHIEEFKTLILATSIYTPFLFFQSIFNGIYTAIGRFDALQITTIGSRATHVFLTITLIAFFGNPLEMAAAATIIASVLTFSLSALYTRFLWPEIGISFSGIKKQQVLGFFSLSWQGLLISACPIIIYYSQEIIISRWIGADQLAAYATAAILSTQARTIINSLSSPLFTKASKLQAEKNHHELKILFKNGIQRSIWIWIAISGPLAGGASHIISAWAGTRFQSSGQILTIQLIGTLGIPLYLSAFHIFNAMGKLRTIAIQSITMLFLFLALSIYFTKFTTTGMTGIALSAAIPLLLRGAFVFYSANNSLQSFRGTETLKLAIITLSLFSVSAAISMKIMQLPDSNSLTSVILASAISAGITITLGFFLIAPTSDRNSIKNAFQKRLKASKAQ